MPQLRLPSLGFSQCHSSQRRRPFSSHSRAADLLRLRSAIAECIVRVDLRTEQPGVHHGKLGLAVVLYVYALLPAPPPAMAMLGPPATTASGEVQAAGSGRLDALDGSQAASPFGFACDNQTRFRTTRNGTPRPGQSPTRSSWESGASTFRSIPIRQPTASTTSRA